MIEVVEGGLTSVPGFLAAGVRAGIKRRGLDVALLVSESGPVPAAGAFTTNLVKGASVLVTMDHLERGGKLAAVVANSGCANSYTGRRGLRDAREMARLVARSLGVSPQEVAVVSTGLIGSHLPTGKVRSGIRAALMGLSKSRAASLELARAVMTTDTSPKEIAVSVKLADGRKVTIAGIAKGAGMIRPKLRVATMVALIGTNARLTAPALKTCLQASVDRSFNMITVDNETSTNDAVLILANGLAGNRTITVENLDRNFQEGLDHVLTELARMIAGDGEGGTHLIEVSVRNARDEKDARKAALAVAGSNLVKASVFGGDPNWGRVVAALGHSGATFDPAKLSIELASEFGSVRLVERGKPGSRSELFRAKGLMRARDVALQIDLAAGRSCAKAWGCDLTPDFVRINSRYYS